VRKIVQIAYRVPTADSVQRYGSVRKLFSPAAQRELEERQRKLEEHRRKSESLNGTEDGLTLRVEVDAEHLGRPRDAPDTPVNDEWTSAPNALDAKHADQLRFAR